MPGLLAQLPDLGDLEQVRGLIENGLGGVLDQVGQNPAGLVQPLTNAIGGLSGQMPDLGGLLAPLTGQTSQLAGSLPAGLDQQVQGVLPLLQAAEQAITGSTLAPVLDDIRQGRSINEIATTALSAAAQGVVGQLPNLLGDALPAEARAAVEQLTSAAGSVSASDPAALADFLADHMLGVPLEPVNQALAARDGFFGPIEALRAAAGSTIDDAEQVLRDRLGAAATLVELLDPNRASDWQNALTLLRSARQGLDALLAALRAVPGRIIGTGNVLDTRRYTTALRQALQGLSSPGGDASPLGRLSSLEALADNLLEPLDQLIDTLGRTSPAEFSGRIRDGLGQVLAIFDAVAETMRDNPLMHLFEDLQEIVNQVAAAITTVRDAIDAGLRAVVQVAETVAAEFDQVKGQVEAALQALRDTIGQLDVDALVESVEAIFNQLDQLLAAIPVQELKDRLDQALTTVEGLVNMLSETAGAVIDQVKGLAAGLGQIQFGPLAEPVLDALDAIKDAVEAIPADVLPDVLKEQLKNLIDEFKNSFGGNPAQWFEQNVVTKLNGIFDEAAGAVREVVTKLQEKLAQFAEAIGKLDPAKLLEPLTNAFKQLNDALAGLSGEQLLAPVRKLLDEAAAALQKLSPETLLKPLEEAFEQNVLAPLARFKPSDLLKPLAEAFQPLRDLIQKLDFSEAFGSLSGAVLDFLGTTQGSMAGAVDLGGLPGVGGAAGEAQSLLGLLNPATSLDDWASGLNNLLGNFRPGKALEPIQSALAPLDTALSGAPDDLLLAVSSRLQGLTGAPALLDTTAANQRLSGTVEQIAAALEANQPGAIVAGLSAEYGRLQAALRRIDREQLPANLRGQYDAVQREITALDPQVAIGPLANIFASLPAQVRQAGQPLDLSALQGEFGGALAAIGGRLPGFLFGDLTPDRVRAGLAAFSPTAQIQRLDERFVALQSLLDRFGPSVQAAVDGFTDQLRDKLAAISPAALFDRFDELFKPVRDALQALDPQAIGAALDQTYTQLLDALGRINPKVIREAVQQMFQTVVDKFTELRQKLVDAVVAAIDRALGRIRDTLKALDPQALVVGLGNLFQLIKTKLEELDLAGLLEALVTAFDTLKNDLLGTLTQCAERFGGMIDALDAKVEAVSP